MTTSHTAQGLASLGRHGDTMLVHMSPHEVAGLNFLAKKQGTKLTVNPDTGLPEAFSLSGLLGSVLPMFAGAMFPGAGFAMQPLLAGALTGGVLAKVQGKDPLMGGLMGGLGGMSGSNLAFGLKGAATPAAAATSGYVPPPVINGVAVPTPAQIASNIDPSMVNTGLNVPNTSMMNATNLARNTGMIGGAGTLDPIIDNFTKQASGVGNLVTGKPGAFDAFKNAYAVDGAQPLTNFQAATKIGIPIGGAILGGLEPSDIYGEPINMDEARKKQAYDPYATLNLGNDTGLRLVAEGGYIDGYANGGVVSNPVVGGGISDLYNRPEGQTTESISQDGYGIGRLSTLANAESMNSARTLGYAMGGPVSFADGGDAMKLRDEITPVGQDMGLTSLMPPATMPTPSSQAMPTGQVQNVATGLSDTASSDSSIIAQVATNLRTDPNYQPKNPIEAAIVKQIKGTDQTQQGQGLGLGSIAPSQPMAPSFNASQAMTPTYYAGMNAPRGFAHGGYLNGQGDGMSDSIPATIEGKQPARLADGEFVVPADVVSHLGNGSSKAGSKRLYAMLDKVRHARTGNKKQGKEIKADKYLPA